MGRGRRKRGRSELVGVMLLRVMAFEAVAFTSLNVRGVHWCTIKYSSEDGRINCFYTCRPVSYIKKISKLHRYAQSMISGYIGEETASLNPRRQIPQTSSNT